MYIHPAIDTPELEAISANRRPRRVQDYRIFSSEEIHAYIDSLAIQRIKWRELQKLQKQRLRALETK